MTSEPCSVSIRKEKDPEKYYQKENALKEEILFQRIKTYYESDRGRKLLDQLMHICSNAQSELSLRKIDALISRNCQGNICYYIAETVPFNMIASYVQQLRHYQKRYFDSFRRRKKVTLPLEDGRRFLTSYCQLNFFIWADRYGLLKYIVEYGKSKEWRDTTAKKNKRLGLEVIMFGQPIMVPAIPLPPVNTRVLLLSAERETAILQQTVLYHYVTPIC